MANIIRTAEAQKDAAEIWLHIAIDNPAAADKLIATFDRKLLQLAENPHLGRSRDDLSGGLRSHPVGNYLIFYRPLPDGIVVARVLHGARDLPRIFKRLRNNPEI